MLGSGVRPRLDTLSLVDLMQYSEMDKSMGNTYVYIHITSWYFRPVTARLKYYQYKMPFITLDCVKPSYSYGNPHTLKHRPDIETVSSII